MDQLARDLEDMLYQINVKHCGQEAADAAREAEGENLGALVATLQEQADKYPVDRGTLAKIASNFSADQLKEALPPELCADLCVEQVEDLLSGVLAAMARAPQ